MAAVFDLSDLNGTNGFTLTGLSAGDKSGTSVAGLGDVNGDGIDDFIVGSPYGDANGTNAGESYVVFGTTSGFAANLAFSDLTGVNGFTLNGDDASDHSGDSVSSAGDLNGDGINDIMIGATLGDPNGSNSGETYIVFGTSSGFGSTIELSALNGSNGFAIRGIDASDQSGYSTAAIGDVNGDGVDDILIGAYRADPNGADSGESYVVFGSTAGFAAALELSALNGSNGFVLNGIDAGDRSGIAVSGAGDVNGDGIDDFLIGAHLAAPNGSESGETYVVFGSTGGFSASFELSNLNGANGFIINGAAAFDASGRAVSNAGDINGDGIDDIVVGALLADTNATNAGDAYVIFGSTSAFSASFELTDLDGSNGFVLSGVDATDYAGFAVSNAGDIDGDGIDDLLVSAFKADPNGSDSGEVYVVYGATSGFGAAIELSALNGSNGFIINGIAAGDSAGFSVASAGDINNDGFDDIIIGARLSDSNGADSGESYVFFGGGVTLDAAGGVSRYKTIEEAQDNAFSGDTIIVNMTYRDSEIIQVDVNDLTFELPEFVGDAIFIMSDTVDSLTITGNGDAIIAGGSNDDTFDAAGGDDVLLGGSGNDRIGAGLGDDFVAGGSGNDSLAGQLGNDTLLGEAGDDKVYGSGGDDRVSGGAGNDTVVGSGGDDTLNGGVGDDLILGNGENDKLIGLDGNDKLVGVRGDNQHFGGQGNDTIKGGSGDDTIRGGAGDDFLLGQAGIDKFIFKPGQGDDIIGDFSTSSGDVIELNGFGAAFDDFSDVTAAATQVGSDVVINLGNGNSLTLTGVLLGDLSVDDFLFT